MTMVAAFFCLLIPVQGASAADGFVTRSGAALTVDGAPYRFTGTNMYYLPYSSNDMIDRSLDAARDNAYNVVRTWGFQDSDVQEGIWFQSWNGSAPVYNDGPTGLQRLDYVIWKAKQNGIKLIIPFTNNWPAYGGMDKYVGWAGNTHHDDFYGNPTIVSMYEAYIGHLLNHVNALTGLAYKDDPTILSWELANEPRCGGDGPYPASITCSTSNKISTWADRVSTSVKAADPHHLVAVGDEGFYCRNRLSTDITINCSAGYDTTTLASLPNIDFLTYHLYPETWNKSDAWGDTWITQHDSDAAAVGKPALLEEFGLENRAARDTVYRRWSDLFFTSGGTGLLFWMLAVDQDDGTPYYDDGFTIFCPSSTCQVLTAASETYTPVAPEITSQPPVAGRIGDPYSYAVQATGSPAPAFSVSSGSLPPGLQLDPATGVISGTPTAPGSYVFTISAGNTAGTATQDVTVAIAGAVPDAPIVTGATGPDASDGYTLHGTALPGATITATDSSGRGVGTTVVGGDGTWRLPIQPGEGSSPLSITQTVDGIVSPPAVYDTAALPLVNPAVALLAALAVAAAGGVRLVRRRPLRRHA